MADNCFLGEKKKGDSCIDPVIKKKVDPKSECNDDSCLVEKIETTLHPKDALKALAKVKPSGPAGNTDWLSDKNLGDVLKRMHAINPEFLPVQYQMSDFVDYVDETSSSDLNVDILEIKNLGNTNKQFKRLIAQGLNCIGSVINTDRRGQPGRHWFCMFVDWRKSPITVEYFNSSGDPILPSVGQWQLSTCSDLKKIFPNKEVKCIDVMNGCQIQQSNTECGVFCLYYIWHRTRGIPYTSFTTPDSWQKIIDGTDPDHAMIKFRSLLFQ